MRKFDISFICAFGILAVSCGDNGSDPKDPVICPPGDVESVLYVVNAGNYQWSNASVTAFAPETNVVISNFFFNANNFKLGDTAQSALIHGAQAWLVVNNSNVIFGVDCDNFIETGRIEKLESPRYMQFVDNNKAYVSQMYTDSIAVVDPTQYKVTGKIHVPVEKGSLSDGSTEEFVRIGQYVFSNLWSYGNSIIKIDTKSDKVVSSLKTGVQPYSIVKDKNEMIWCICDGGAWEDNPAGYEAPSILCIDPETMSITKSFSLKLGDGISKLAVNSDGSAIYWIVNRHDAVSEPDDSKATNTAGVYRMEVDSYELPAYPIVPADNRNFYSLTVSPLTEEIYVADAIDYSQNGIVYRYSKNGEKLGAFQAGINPTSYAWRVK